MSVAQPSILAVVDPTIEVQPVVARAAWLAAQLRCPLELFICIHDPDAKDTDAKRRALEVCRARLTKLAASLAASDPELIVTTEVRWDRPLEDGIVRKVLDSNTLLVAKDTHEHATLKQTLFSNTDWNLIRACPVPLLLVKPGFNPPSKHVIAAVDPLHESDTQHELDRAILTFANRLSMAFDGTLHIVHMFDPTMAIAAATNGMSPLTMEPAGMTQEIVQANEVSHRRAMDTLLSRAAPTQYELHFQRGNVREELPDLAKELGAGFVVLGAVERGAVGRLLIGSTAERILDRLPCDLIVVKPPRFETSVK
jgi:universal stress protein E